MRILFDSVVIKNQMATYGIRQADLARGINVSRLTAKKFMEGRTIYKINEALEFIGLPYDRARLNG